MCVPPSPGSPPRSLFQLPCQMGLLLFFYVFIAAVFGRLAGLRSTRSGWVKGRPCRRCRNPEEITGLRLQGGPGGRRGAGAGGGGRQRARSGGSPRPPRRSGAERAGLRHGGEQDAPPVRIAGVYPVAARRRGAR